MFNPEIGLFPWLLYSSYLTYMMAFHITAELDLSGETLMYICHRSSMVLQAFPASVFSWGGSPSTHVRKAVLVTWLGLPAKSPAICLHYSWKQTSQSPKNSTRDIVVQIAAWALQPTWPPASELGWPAQILLCSHNIHTASFSTLAWAQLAVVPLSTLGSSPPAGA